MVSSVFFDHTSSYHPLPRVIEILKKPMHPHALSSLIRSPELLFKTMEYKKAVAQYLGARQPRECILTAGAQEALRLMIDDVYFQDIFHSGKQHVLTEAEGVLRDAVEHLKLLGVVVESMATDQKGHLTPESLRRRITPRTALFSCLWANPLTGVIQPVSDLAAVCRAEGVLMHLDASHVIGKLYFNLADFPVDYVTFDAQPFHGPYLVGGLITQRARTLDAQDQIAPIQLEALEAALSHAQGTIDEMNLEIARLRNSFQQQLLAKIPTAQVLCQDVERLPHISVIAFPYIHQEYFLYLLAQDHVYASIGDGHQMLLESVLRSMGVETTLARCAVSFSFSYITTQEEIDYAVECIDRRYRQAQTLMQGII